MLEWAPRHGGGRTPTLPVLSDPRPRRPRDRASVAGVLPAFLQGCLPLSMGSCFEGRVGREWTDGSPTLTAGVPAPVLAGRVPLTASEGPGLTRRQPSLRWEPQDRPGLGLESGAVWPLAQGCLNGGQAGSLGLRGGWSARAWAPVCCRDGSISGMSAGVCGWWCSWPAGGGLLSCVSRA